MSNRIGSSLHDWINSIGMIITFCVAIVAAVISWKTYQLKEEDLLVAVKPTDDCLVEFIYFLPDNSELTQEFLSICWIATVSNKSENKISIVKNYISDLNDAGKPMPASRGGEN